MPDNKRAGNMSGAEALTDYGFTKGDGGVYAVAGSSGQIWIEADGGFTRLDIAPSVMGGAVDANAPAGAEGQPWGRPYAPSGGRLLEVPYTQSVKWANVSGLHPLTHPECFDWIWPDAVVAELYAYAYKEGRPAYKRVTQGDGADAHEVMVEDKENKLGR